MTKLSGGEPPHPAAAEQVSTLEAALRDSIQQAKSRSTPTSRESRRRGDRDETSKPR